MTRPNHDLWSRFGDWTIQPNPTVGFQPWIWPGAPRAQEAATGRWGGSSKVDMVQKKSKESGHGRLEISGIKYVILHYFMIFHMIWPCSLGSESTAILILPSESSNPSVRRQGSSLRCYGVREPKACEGGAEQSMTSLCVFTSVHSWVTGWQHILLVW